MTGCRLRNSGVLIVFMLCVYQKTKDISLLFFRYCIFMHFGVVMFCVTVCLQNVVFMAVCVSFALCVERIMVPCV